MTEAAVKEICRARRRFVVGIGAAVSASAVAPLVPDASAAPMLAKNEEEITVAQNSLSEEVRQFIAAYDAAFQTFDGAKIVQFYHAPCITVRGDGSVHSFQTRPEIEKFFGGVAEKYNADGLRSGTFYDLEVIPIGARSVLATVTWEQWREDKSVLRKWRHSYNLVRADKNWQILTSTFHLS
jgi:ketosteroid isomerase-like protein